MSILIKFGISSDQRLNFMLFLDCSKGFNHLTHQWFWRVAEHCRLPRPLVLCILRIVEMQLATLVFAGCIFEEAEWRCGYRQGGPCSLDLYFYHRSRSFLSRTCKSQRRLSLWGFCDDWKLTFDGIAPIRNSCHGP